MPWWMRNCENLDKAIFPGVGPYDIPQMEPVTLPNAGQIEFIGCNYAKGCQAPENKGVHFFLEDYQFFRYWTGVELYMPMLQKFRCVCTPDFSLYTDFPKAVQLYNHYRKHWLGAYWQQKGLTVIPSVSWSDERSLAWCFDGDPVGGVVAVSSVGTQMNSRCRRLFLTGYERMIAQLSPTMVLFHGDVPPECRGNIVKIGAHQAKLRQIAPDLARR